MHLTGQQLQAQYVDAFSLWPFFRDIEQRHDLAPFLLFAVGSRETNLRKAFTEGRRGDPEPDGHGHGLFQLDDRWHVIPIGFDYDARMQAELAAAMLAGLYAVTDDWIRALNRYNSGQDDSAKTTPPPYGPDVWERRAYLEKHFGAGGRMETWYPEADRRDVGGGSPVDVGSAVLVLHTTESPGPASYSGSNPHFEVSLQAGVIQFVALDCSSFALYNAPGGVQTNRRAGHVIQIEIVWYAANAANMPDDLLSLLARLTTWIAAQLDLPLVPAPQGFHGSDEGIVLATDTSPIRFSYEDWDSFSGICGHQHVPENDHWDPGAFPWSRFAALLGAPTQEDDLAGSEEMLGHLNDQLTYVNQRLQLMVEADHANKADSTLEQILTELQTLNANLAKKG